MMVENQTKNYLCTPFTRAWFPNGPTDPDLARIQFNIVHAASWDVKESKMLYLA
jgi:general stress protein 26